MYQISVLEQATKDIVYKNMQLVDAQTVVVYDRQSELSNLVADAYIHSLPSSAKALDFDIVPHEEIINTIFSLPKGSLVILVQSTNFRLSEFRIRFELFNKGVGVVEHNHLGYIPSEHINTFIESLVYRGDFYKKTSEYLMERIRKCESMRVVSEDGSVLHWGAMEEPRANIGDYSNMQHKGGTFPIGEVFSEARDLESVQGEMLLDTYPDENFQIVIEKPFKVLVEKGRIVLNNEYPEGFKKLMDKIAESENGEVYVREFGLGLNPAITNEKCLSDVNFHERKLGLHLSLGKKHAIYGKKMKDEVQRYHIDVFVALDKIYIDDEIVYGDGEYKTDKA